MSRIIFRFRNERPPLKPSPQKSPMGAPTMSYSRKSSTLTGELAQRMLSAWNRRTCLAGASCSQNQGFVRKEDTEWLVLSFVPSGMCLTRMRESSTALRKGAEVERLALAEIGRTMGQVGPRMEE